MRRVRGAAILAAALIFLGACGRGASRAADVRVGVISMLSGDDVTPTGAQLGHAARLAAKEANARGGVRVGSVRRLVTIVEVDDHNSPDAAVDAARSLIFRDHVVALIGPQFSSNAIPVARLAEQERVPMICPMSTHPDTTAGKRFVFRVPYIDTFQGAVLARFARQRLAVRSAAVLYDVTGVYNETLATIFSRTFSSLGGTIVASETYTPEGRGDLATQLGRIRALEPDLLFLPNYANDVMLQARQARELGIQAILLGGDGWDSAAFSAEPAFRGSFHTTPWHAALQTPQSVAFLAAYSTACAAAPTDLAATTYDAVNMLLAAIETAESTDAEAIRQALASMAPFAGVTGTIAYRGSGDPVKSAAVVQIVSGATAVHTIMEP